MENQNQYDYAADYEAFLGNFKKTEVSGEEVGEQVARMANYFIRYNLRMCDALRNFSNKKAEFQAMTDPASGKPMSSTKAEMLADATPEAANYELARVHVLNIEQCINALKALQKGVLVEYSNAA